MNERLIHAVSASLGSSMRTYARAHGGDINDAYDVTLADGRLVFVKSHDEADPRMFACEARGLEWLRAAGAIRIPRVLAYGDDDVAFLVLERIAPAARADDYEVRLGRELAALHRSAAAATPAAASGSLPAASTLESTAKSLDGRFGFPESNFIGSLTQDNTFAARWPEFYVTRRLEPQVRAAIDRHIAPASWQRGFARLFAMMDDLTGPPEPPSRLHGDLWSGNVMVDDAGAPCLIDPAVYAGHREVDLAMLRLFGGLGARTLAAYHEAAPLAEGHASRVALYQLYPLLVHVNLFGGSYVTSVERALQQYL
jgi:fructosamine-3-kinase